MEEKSGVYFSIEEDLDISLGLVFLFALCDLLFRLDAMTSDAILEDLFSPLGNLFEYNFRKEVCGESYFG